MIETKAAAAAAASEIDLGEFESHAIRDLFTGFIY